MNKKKSIIFIIIVSTILIAGHVFAADVTVHIDEKQLISTLISQIIGQLNQAKTIILKTLPVDFGHKIIDLISATVVLAIKLGKEAIVLFSHIAMPDKK